jgi:hypothetical protein
MSTKCTISYSDDYHLYEEIGDRHNVYLRLDPGDWAASLATATVDWHDGEHTRPILTLKINVDTWRQIVVGWSESHWGKDASRDHKEPEWKLDNKWLEMMREKIKEDEAAGASVEKCDE